MMQSEVVWEGRDYGGTANYFKTVCADARERRVRQRMAWPLHLRPRTYIVEGEYRTGRRSNSTSRPNGVIAEC